jgi:hypothetical protein
LQGNVPIDHEYRVIEIQLLQATPVATKPLPTDIQSLLDAFASVFSTPEGLPPQRVVSHSIPLIEGARPVQIRPYRFAPELKDEIEKQIFEMLQSGVIRPSSSNFASPLIMVKKKDRTWRLCVDYH